MATDNHNFAQPERGALDWNEFWYDNFDALDERVVLRGPAADRNNYTGYADALYLATDTEEVYEGTGSGWSQLESFGENPTFASVNTDEASIGSLANIGDGKRPHISNGDRTIVVPDDQPTLQDALDEVPVICRHKYTIDIQTDLSTEDAVVHPSMFGDGFEGAGYEYGSLLIFGNGNEIGSLTVTGCVGKTSPYVDTLVGTQGNPWDDEDAVFLTAASSNPSFANCSIAGAATKGFVCYSGSMTVNSPSLGTDNVGNGFWVKHSGEIYLHGASTGSVTNTKYVAGTGCIHYKGDDDGMSGPSTASTSGGYVLDTDNGTVYGIHTFQNRLQLLDDAGNAQSVFLGTSTDRLRINEGMTKNGSGADAGTSELYVDPFMSFVDSTDTPFLTLQSNGVFNYRGSRVRAHQEGSTTSDPTTDAPAGFWEIQDSAGNTRYIPFYA